MTTDAPSLTADLVRIIRVADDQSRHRDWGEDARAHWHKAGCHLLEALAAVKRAELGIPVSEETMR